jgi:alpha-tubulin suppressor-like RCC1 family protein
VSNAPTDSTFSQVSAGTKHSCAIRSDGYLTCWGYDYYGQVSDAPTGITFNHISAGEEHNCAISSLGKIYCWGNADYGVLAIDYSPFFTSRPVTWAIMDKPYTYSITATDPDVIHHYYLIIEGVDVPSWLTFTDHGDGTATLTGTPGTSHLGNHRVLLAVEDDDQMRDTQTFIITVTDKLFIYLPLIIR